MSGTSAKRQQRCRLTVAPQLAYKATSSVGSGRFLAFLQASDQKVSEDMRLQGERKRKYRLSLSDTTFAVAADATRA